MEAGDKKKNNFDKILQNIIDDIPQHDIKRLIGDFNVQIDKSHQGVKSIIGPHCLLT